MSLSFTTVAVTLETRTDSHVYRIVQEPRLGAMIKRVSANDINTWAHGILCQVFVKGDRKFVAQAMHPGYDGVWFETVDGAKAALEHFVSQL